MVLQVLQVSAIFGDLTLPIEAVLSEDHVGDLLGEIGEVLLPGGEALEWIINAFEEAEQFEDEPVERVEVLQVHFHHELFEDEIEIAVVRRRVFHQQVRNRRVTRSYFQLIGLLDDAVHLLRGFSSVQRVELVLLL